MLTVIPPWRSTTGKLSLKAENNTDSTAKADGSAVAPQVKFDGGDVGTVKLADDFILLTDPGLTTGSRVTYRNGGGTSIGGLSNNQTYYVRVEGGAVSLFDTKAHAEATSATAGRVDLTSLGTGSNHSLGALMPIRRRPTRAIAAVTTTASAASATAE